MPEQYKIYLAPFQGITGITFRKVFVNYFEGVDKLFTPFFTTIHHNSKLPARKLAELGNPSENGIQTVPQILSKDADEIIRFSRFCESLGFKEINWNLGCPYPQVADKKRGSGMLPYPEMIDTILQRVLSETALRFSVKCRLGYFSSNEIFDLIPVFNQHYIPEIIIHARIGKQLYSGTPDQDTFLRAISQLKIPVVYNGDIFTKTDFENYCLKFPAMDTWMIGRGLLYDPFLPADIKGMLTEDDRKAYIRKYIEDLYYAYRRQMNDNLSAISVLKEYWSYLAISFSNPHKVFKKIKRVTTFGKYEDAVSQVFDEFDWVGYKDIPSV